MHWYMKLLQQNPCKYACFYFWFERVGYSNIAETRSPIISANVQTDRVSEMGVVEKRSYARLSLRLVSGGIPYIATARGVPELHTIRWIRVPDTIGSPYHTDSMRTRLHLNEAHVQIFFQGRKICNIDLSPKGLHIGSRSLVGKLLELLNRSESSFRWPQRTISQC